MGKKKLSPVSNQISFVDLIQMFSFSDSSSTNSCKSNSGVEEEKEDYSSYLKKGERILSLLREKTKRLLGSFKNRPVFDALNFKTYSSYESADEKVAYVLRRMKTVARSVTAITDEESLTELKMLLDGLDIIESVEPADEYCKELMAAVFREREPREALMLHIRGMEEAVCIPKGNAAVPTKYHGCEKLSIHRANRYVYVCDPASAFSSLVLFCQLWQMAKDTFKGMDYADKQMNALYMFFYQYITDAVSERQLMTENKTVIPIQEHENNCYVRRFLEDRGLSYEVLSPLEFMRKAEVEGVFLLKSRRNIMDLNMVFFLEESLDISELSVEIRRIFTGRKAWSNFFSVGISTYALVNVIDKVFAEYLEDKRDYEMAKGMISEYAQSFETKHNIPLKVQKAMSESPFNKYFGYVEYDEDVDLSLMDQIYKEFAAVAQFIGLKKQDEVSLRFRKLGNHKATGLYYFVLKCLCVDIRCPSSFAHEMMHMVDDENGKLSRSYGFEKTLELYRSSLEEELDKDPMVRKILEGKGKFDKEYYLQSSECFARCGEIYLVRICSIDNSIVKPDEKTSGFAYPRNEKLEESVKEYFDALFKKNNRVDLTA